jgi:glutamine synthetase
MSTYLRHKALDLIHTREPVEQEEKAKSEDITAIWEVDCYGMQAMRETLPSHCFKKLREVINSGKELDRDIAEMVANGMKEWALKKGATHYTHWFQPLTGSAAEKHDSFISIYPGEERLTLEFSDIALIKGEPDASSFPSGGLRSTWEARGYTVWDATSPAFIWKGKNGSVLSIPTAFCSWTGEALDMKTPLLRSMEVLSNEAVQLLELIGEKCTKVTPTLGIEQEFFMVDKGFYLARPDLVATGRTLLGAKPPKGQELEDHYFATMNQRIMACMQEVEWKMWKLGLPLKTRHNEVAPGQYEFAPIFERVNVASDHNTLLMEVLRTTATRHNLVALLHEKPFAGVNGSGKHNNWSMSTNTGKNLLDPGETPLQNARFLLFLTAVIRAVDLHADLLRCSVATPGNDHRLGANEAPPAIVSVYLGDLLDQVVRAVMNSSSEVDGANVGEGLYVQLGVSALPPLPRDATDRNRTSTFAFTGNKFEFRAVGSSQPVAFPNIILNTIVAESVKYLREKISGMAKTGVPVEDAMNKIVKATLKQHYRIVFNGDGYSAEWRAEAEKRGLPNMKNTPEALKVLGIEKNIKLFEDSHVMVRNEVVSRQHVMFEHYNKTITIEAKSLLSIVRTSIIPAAMTYQKKVADVIASISVPIPHQKKLLEKVVDLVEKLLASVEELHEAVHHHDEDLEAHAFHLTSKVTPKMLEVRHYSDSLEHIVDDDLWPLPKYSEILFLR